MDGTVGNAGFSSTPWTQTQAGGSLTWATETFAQNQNANAIRWGTLYNFRFDSDRPPTVANATVGFFKTGSPITVQVQVPSAAVASSFTVSGRVLTAEGLPIRGATVTIDDRAGNTRLALTGSFGYYVFENVASGPTYDVSASAKRFRFTTQAIQVTDNVWDLNFLPNP